MAKKCKAVFRDKNLQQQLTCFLEFGSQILKSGRKDWRFLSTQAPNHQEFDRSALAPPSPASNVNSCSRNWRGITLRCWHIKYHTSSWRMNPDPARRAENSISSSVGRGEGVSGTECLLQTPGKVCPLSQHIFMAGSAGSLSTLLLTAQTQALTASPPWDTSTAVRTLAQWRTGCPENQKWNYLTSGLGSPWTHDFHVALGHSTCKVSLIQVLGIFISCLK